MSDGMVRLADKQPKDGQRCRVRRATFAHTTIEATYHDVSTRQLGYWTSADMWAPVRVALPKDAWEAWEREVGS